MENSDTENSGTENSNTQNRPLYDLFGTDQPVALITGAGKNRLGRAIAERLGESGYRLAIHANSSSQEAQEYCVSRPDVRAIPVTADIRDEHAVVAMIEQVYDEFERIDVLVNTAAIWNSKPLEEVMAEDVRQHFEVNVLGTFLCAKHAGEVMIGQPRGGAIVNFGDWAVARPYEGFAAYFASKGAVETMTRSLAVEFAARNQGIRVNAILPGPVMLPQDLSDEKRAVVVNGTLGKREGTGQEVAQATQLLIENPFVNGVTLPVDSGRSIYAPDQGSWKIN